MPTTLDSLFTLLAMFFVFMVFAFAVIHFVNTRRRHKRLQQRWDRITKGRYRDW